MIDGKDYQQMKKDILDHLAMAMLLDAVAPSLHGAGVAERRECGGGSYIKSRFEFGIQVF